MSHTGQATTPGYVYAFNGVSWEFVAAGGPGPVPHMEPIAGRAANQFTTDFGAVADAARFVDAVLNVA